jgi:hypothetical protein
LLAGASIWAPRDAKHRWANVGSSEGKLLLTCLPGGFEKFFAELAGFPKLTPNDQAAMHKLHDLHLKYGMELLGPPIYP